MTDTLQALTNSLLEKGYRLTRARRVICETLVSTGGHLSPDDLVTAVHQRDPGIGRMTVYRTLDLLCELGQVRPVYHGGGAAQYIVLEDGHHHHLVCTVCGQVIEFADCVVDPIAELLSAQFDFQIDSHLLELFGRCGDCQE